MFVHGSLFYNEFWFFQGVIPRYNLRLIKQLINHSFIRINFPSILYITILNIFIA